MQSAVLAMTDYVWPSDRPSDTRRYHAKRTRYNHAVFTRDSPM